jgi:hypothetical protein
MADRDRTGKLIGKVEHLIVLLEHHHEVIIHERICQSYYMQKLTELQFIQEQFRLTLVKKEFFANLLEASYLEVANRWKHDIRWLKKHLDAKRKVPIL